MVKFVNVMRGDPVVTPLAACQWFDQCVRLAFLKIQRAYPPLISFTARLPSTCVSCTRSSRLVSAVDPVAAGWLVLPGSNGRNRRPSDTLPIIRTCGEIW